ncbi:MAG: hypothetical protein ACREXP_26685 [Steroidobacteraceae bacterium]
MSAPQFANTALPEKAWQRRVRLAVDVVDAVTGELIRDGIKVTVKEFRNAPIVNASGRYVWMLEPGVVPTEVEVDPQRLPYLQQSRPVPPPSLPPPPRTPLCSVVRIELPPTSAYPFEAGTTGVRSTLIRDSAEFPPVPLPSDEVWLQWSDDNQPAPGWTDAPVRTRTDAAGDFAVIVRLATNQIARTDAQGRMQVRVAATHAGVTQFSPPQHIRPGYVADVKPSLAWNLFTL